MASSKQVAFRTQIYDFIKGLTTKSNNNQQEYNWDVLITVINDRKTCFNCYVKRGEAGMITTINMDGLVNQTMRINKVFMYDQSEILDLFIGQFADDVDLWVKKELGITE